jgi:hypothetical protein
MATPSTRLTAVLKATRRTPWYAVPATAAEIVFVERIMFTMAAGKTGRIELNVPCNRNRVSTQGSTPVAARDNTTEAVARAAPGCSALHPFVRICRIRVG